MLSYVYLITNHLSGKVYVGKTTNPKKRWGSHLVDSRRETPTSYIGRALKKHGRANFDFSVLERCGTEDRAYERERHWVAHYGSDQKGRGYNLESGGRGGKIASEATRRKQSEARKGKPRPPGVMAKCHTPEALAKRAAAVRGRRHSPEWNAKISAAHLGKPKSPEQVEKSAAAHRGKPFTPEHRKKLSLAGRGRLKSPSHRLKLAEANKERGHSTSAQLPPQDVGLIRLLRDEGLAHTAIAKRLGVSPALVGKVLNGRGCYGKSEVEE